MKITKIVLALILALCMVASIVACGNSGDDKTTTTAAPGTNAPAQTTDGGTTAPGTEPATTTGDSTDDPVPGDAAENVDVAKIEGLGRVPVDLESVTFNEEFKQWADGESAVHAFDGKYLEGSSSKIGGTSQGTIILTFKTVVPVTAQYYAIVTGNDTQDSPSRNPSAWTLSGSKDGGENWTELDKVTNTGLEAVNYTVYAYEIDAPEEYQTYKIEITCDGGGFQLNEIMIMGQNFANVDVDTEGMIKAEIDAESISAEGINPWGDNESASKLFDGEKGVDADNTGTKLGGPVQDGKFTVSFKTTAPFAPYYYAITTGNDSAVWTGRTPTGWTLSGSADGENWDTLDTIVTDDKNHCGMYDANYKTFVYRIDAPKKEYTFFKVEFTKEGDCQLNEFELFALNPLCTTEDVSSLSVAAVKADSIAAEGINVWGDGENAPKLFDGDKGTDADNTGTKLGGGVPEKTFTVTFETESAVTVKAYAITTGNDSGVWTGRNPIAWTLEGSTDGTTYTVISKIDPKTDETAGLLDANFTTYNYLVAEGSQAAYQFYKITFITAGDTCQLNELELLY